MKITISDKLDFTKESLKKNRGILLIGALFIVIGSVLIYIATGIENHIFLYIFGGIFIAFPLFIIVYTMPSSFMYYYEQAQIKKYGSFTTAVITHKEIEDNSYTEKIDNRIERIEELNYLISFTFNYQNNEFVNSFYVNTKEAFEALKIGNSIPIKFLKTDPKKSSVRLIKLSKEIGLKIDKS